MDTYTLVRPEHLNHHGYLFGGNMLKWVDELAWLVASRDFPGCTLVTIGMNDIVFDHRVLSGSILCFHILPHRQGQTSITYTVTVYADPPGGSTEEKVFSTNVTFVRLDDEGAKTPLPAREQYRSETG